MTRWVGAWPGQWPGSWQGGQEASPFVNLSMRVTASATVTASLEAAGGSGGFADMSMLGQGGASLWATLAGGDTQQHAGRSNLRDVWTFKPFEVRVRGRKKVRRYKTAQAATTAARAEAKAGVPVVVAYLGQPVELPSLRTATFADILDRLALVERQQAAEFEREQVEALKEAAIRRRKRDDEEALVLALARLWRL